MEYKWIIEHLISLAIFLMKKHITFKLNSTIHSWNTHANYLNSIFRIDPSSIH